MLKHIFISGVSSGASFAFQLGLLSLISHNFSQEEFGLISILATANAFILLFSDFGVNNYIITRSKVSKQMYVSLKRIIIGISTLMASIIIGVSLLYIDGGVLLYGVIITCINVIIISFSIVNKAILQRNQRFENICVIESVPRAIILILSLCCYLFWEGTRVNVLQAYFIPTILLSITTTAWYKLHSASIKTGLSSNPFSLNQDFFKFTQPLFANSILNFITQNIDLLIIAKFMGVSAAGAYTILKQLVIRPVQVIAPAFTNVMISKLSVEYHRGCDISTLYMKGVNYITSNVLIVLLVLSVFSEEIILLLFGDNWSSLFDILPIFMCYGVLRASFIPIGALLSVVNKNDLALKYTIVQNLMLIPLLIIVSGYNSMILLVNVIVLYHLVLMLFHWKCLVNPFIRVGFFRYHYVICICLSILCGVNYV